MAETFRWLVERDVTPKIDYKTTAVQFGDGYEQVIIEGINNKREEYSVKIHAYEKEAREIKAFFDRHQGAKAFFWTPPLETIGLYRCNDATPTPQGGGLFVFNCTFKKSFAAPGS
jgi:phage-related protein